MKIGSNSQYKVNNNTLIMVTFMLKHENDQLVKNNKLTTLRIRKHSCQCYDK